MKKARRRAVILSSLLACACVTLLLAQQAAPVTFRPPEDVVLVWTKRVGLLMIAAAFTLVLYTLVGRYGRLWEANSKWLLFFGLCVLPTPVLFLSNAVGLEESKAVEFCESCHVMDAFLEDMRDPESGTLTARHYRKRLIQRAQCWACHSDYGIFGTLEAKVSGLVDVYRYVTGTYRLPIQMRHDYRFTICLNCHGESSVFLEEASHEGVIEATLSGEFGCTGCHDLAHPEREKRSTE